MSVVIETTLGDITVDLFLEERPQTCINFLKLCKIKYYNFNLFHTVSRGFIAQTGDPTGTRSGGESVYGVIDGETKRYFEAENEPRIKHTEVGLISFVGGENNMVGSQFFITLGEDLTYLDEKHCVFGKVVEGFDILEAINEVICDKDDQPYQDVRITHTVVLDDPYPDPKGLNIPSRSPSPSMERLKGGKIAPDEEIDDFTGKSATEVAEMTAEREAKARATILEMIGDIPDAEIAPPENVLFVCKLNPVTTDDDLEIIFSRFGKIKFCEVIRDKKTGDSLQYAFIEFEEQKSCEDAYFKMDNVLIDDRRIHVDFSQSVSKVKWLGKGRVTHFDDKGNTKNFGDRNIGQGNYKFNNGVHRNHNSQARPKTTGRSLSRSMSPFRKRDGSSSSPIRRKKSVSRSPKRGISPRRNRVDRDRSRKKRPMSMSPRRRSRSPKRRSRSPLGSYTRDTQKGSFDRGRKRRDSRSPRRTENKMSEERYPKERNDNRYNRERNNRNRNDLMSTRRELSPKRNRSRSSEKKLRESYGKKIDPQILIRKEISPKKDMSRSKGINSQEKNEGKGNTEKYKNERDLSITKKRSLSRGASQKRDQSRSKTREKTGKRHESKSPSPFDLRRYRESKKVVAIKRKSRSLSRENKGKDRQHSRDKSTDKKDNDKSNSRYSKKEEKMRMPSSSKKSRSPSVNKGQKRNEEKSKDRKEKKQRSRSSSSDNVEVKDKRKKGRKSKKSETDISSSSSSSSSSEEEVKRKKSKKKKSKRRSSSSSSSSSSSEDEKRKKKSKKAKKNKKKRRKYSTSSSSSSSSSEEEKNVKKSKKSKSKKKKKRKPSTSSSSSTSSDSSSD